MFACKEEGKFTMVCEKHNGERLKRRVGADFTPKVQTAGSIMSDAMKRALESPQSVRKSIKAVKEVAGNINSTIAAMKIEEEETSKTSTGGEGPLDYLVDNLANGNETDQLRTFWEISNLTKDEKSLNELTEPNLGLLATLAKIISKDSTSSNDCKAAACGVLWNLSVSHENRIHMIDPSISLITSMTHCLLGGHQDTMGRCLGCLHNLSLSEEAQPIMGSNAALVDSLTTLLGADTDASLTDRAAGVFWNMSTCEANRGIMVAHTTLPSALINLLNDDDDSSPKALICIYYLTILASNRPILGAIPSLYTGLMHIMKSSSEILSKVIPILVNLSSANENKAIMGNPSLGLLPVLVDLVLKNDDSQPDINIKGKICGCMWNLSVYPGNRATMANPSLKLLDTIIEIIANSTSPSSSEEEKDIMTDVVIKCCVVIQNIAGAKECHEPLLTAANGKLPSSLIRIILFGKDTVKPKAFGAIVNMSLTEQSQTALGKSDGAFKALKGILADETSPENRTRACGVLQNLSVNAEFRLLIAQESGMLDLLINLIQTGAPLRKNALGLILNLSTVPENKALIYKTTNFSSAVIECMKASSDEDEQVRGASLIWSLCAHQDAREKLKEMNDMIVALTTAAGRGGDVSVKALGALSNLAPSIAAKVEKKG
jgi:hypothetical protein